jgi:uncharacterized protein
MSRQSRIQCCVRAAAIGLAIWVAPGCALPERVQDSLLYYPNQPDDGPPDEFGLSVRDLYVRAADGVKIHAWFFASPKARGNFLFAHGNASNVTGWRHIVQPLLDVGLNVMLFDYRGYGLSEGQPSEEGLYEDAEAALKLLLAQPEAKSLPVYYYGQSLGGAVMTELAVRHEPTALIVQSTFTSLLEMAKHLYKAFPWVPGRFTTLQKVSKLHCPVLVIHGKRDNFVPTSMGIRIYEAVPPSQRRMLLLPDASHGDVWFKDERKVVSAIQELVADTAKPEPQRSSESTSPSLPVDGRSAGLSPSAMVPTRPTAQ